MRALVLITTSFVLFSCSPAVYIRLYNASGEQIIITKDKSKEVITVSPNDSADYVVGYLPGERVLIRTSKHTWVYSPRRLFAPASFVQQHTMVMRAFAKIDARGRIFLLAPPQDHGAPRPTKQPAGFPVNSE